MSTDADWASNSWCSSSESPRRCSWWSPDWTQPACRPEGVHFPVTKQLAILARQSFSTAVLNAGSFCQLFGIYQRNFRIVVLNKPFSKGKQEQIGRVMYKTSMRSATSKSLSTRTPTWPRVSSRNVFTLPPTTSSLNTDRDDPTSNKSYLPFFVSRVASLADVVRGAINCFDTDVQIVGFLFYQSEAFFFIGAGFIGIDVGTGC